MVVQPGRVREVVEHVAHSSVSSASESCECRETHPDGASVRKTQKLSIWRALSDKSEQHSSVGVLKIESCLIMSAAFSAIATTTAQG